MPLTEKGDKIMSHMQGEYGDKKGESVFYASKNAGKISGVDEGEGGGGEKGGGEDFIKSIAGPAAAMALSDTEADPEMAAISDAAGKFDDLRDRMHKFERRLDDCAAMDDRSSEGHEKAAAQLPDGPEKKFHEAEVGRTDGALLTTPTGKKII